MFFFEKQSSLNSPSLSYQVLENFWLFETLAENCKNFCVKVKFSDCLCCLNFPFEEEKKLGTNFKFKKQNKGQELLL